MQLELTKDECGVLVSALEEAISSLRELRRRKVNLGPSYLETCLRTDEYIAKVHALKQRVAALHGG